MKMDEGKNITRDNEVGEAHTGALRTGRTRLRKIAAELGVFEGS